MAAFVSSAPPLLKSASRVQTWVLIMDSKYFHAPNRRKGTYMIKETKFLILSCLTILASAVQAGPFGFEMGNKPSNYQCSEMAEANMYRCASAPKGHPDFEAYVLQATSVHGICWIKAVGKNISDNGYGTSTKRQVDGFVDAIKRSYGEDVEKTDFLLSSSIWNEPDEFLMGIVKRERIYTYHWKSTSDASIGEIYLAAKAVRSDTGYTALEYYGSDYEACSKYSEDQVNDVF